MPYELEIKREETYLYARASGTRTRSAIAAIATEIVENCKQNQVDEVLVDIRELKGPMGIFDSLLIVTKEFPKLKAMNVVKKVAIINAKDRKERSRFFEQMAVKHGYNIRFFEDLTPAIEWLKSGKPVTNKV
jgi:hypothetical protein